MSYHAALAHFPKITYARYHKLAAYFYDLKNLWEAEMTDLTRAGLEENIAHEFLEWREKNPVEKLLENLKKEKIKIISLNDDDYPALLKEISDPPLVLFVRGDLPPRNQPAIAVVGTRKFTAYGKQVCQDLAEQLARRGVVIVSGLALGIDGIAHASALDGGGATVAVLGSGINDNNIYPASHFELARRIIAGGGALVSEYPPGFYPTQYSFPARNRIIAGLSLGVLVIEAAEQSGALITAKCALDYNREVFAVPHSIYSPTGVGPNNLIKLGAKAVTAYSDITDALNLVTLEEVSPKKIATSSSPAEEKILQILTKEPVHIDAIIKQTGFDSPTANSALTILEMKRKIKNLGGMMYIIC